VETRTGNNFKTVVYTVVSACTPTISSSTLKAAGWGKAPWSFCAPRGRGTASWSFGALRAAPWSFSALTDEGTAP
jgi:hypothetical protein